MHRKNQFNIHIDPSKSFESYVYDRNTKTYFLDFFNNYSSQPLGWNHPIFSSDEFREDILRVVNQKLSLNEYITDEGEDFLRLFEKQFPNKNWKAHFCCTGSLAVEAAIKTSLDYKKTKRPKIISLNGSFHGIYGYSSFMSDSSRVSELNITSPNFYRFPSPNLLDGIKKLEDYECNLKILLNAFPNDIVALLIEPIQCTSGDKYFSKEFFKISREFCDENDIILIFDEIQTGFGGTGKFWYNEYLNSKPDIIIFGKKAQVSGILVDEYHQEIFNHPEKLEVTFDGDLIDMIRCKYILKAYKDYNILDNVILKGQLLFDELNDMDEIEYVRHAGLLLAFDINKNKRDKLFNQSIKNKMLVLKGGLEAIRLRPNLTLTTDELTDSIIKIKKCLEEI